MIDDADHPNYEKKLPPVVKDLVAGVAQGMHVNKAAPVTFSDIFDGMTAKGFKLNLITFRYFKP
jgi:hypothetical protein